MLYYVIHTGLLVLVLVHVCILVIIPRELLAISSPLVIYPALRHSHLARLAPLEEVSIYLPTGACLNEPHCFWFWGMVRLQVLVVMWLSLPKIVSIFIADSPSSEAGHE